MCSKLTRVHQTGQQTLLTALMLQKYIQLFGLEILARLYTVDYSIAGGFKVF